uniref:DUF6525 family protein n=1 Tax=Nonomuraea antri TaxID=2730852 RepID=UPI0038B25BD4
MASARCRRLCWRCREETRRRRCRTAGACQRYGRLPQPQIRRSLSAHRCTPWAASCRRRLARLFRGSHSRFSAIDPGLKTVVLHHP